MERKWIFGCQVKTVKECGVKSDCKRVWLLKSCGRLLCWKMLLMLMMRREEMECMKAIFISDLQDMYRVPNQCKSSTSLSMTDTSRAWPSAISAKFVRDLVLVGANCSLQLEGLKHELKEEHSRRARGQLNGED